MRRTVVPFRRRPWGRPSPWISREPEKSGLPVLPVLAAAAMLGAVSGLYLFGPAGTASQAAPAPQGFVGQPDAASQPARSIRFTRCGFGSRANCVVDGDTVWLDGEKIRLSDINTPEISSPSCAAEKRLGERATGRLVELLASGPVQVVDPADSPDRDRYDRLLRELHVGGASVGDTLVREGLAEEWQGYRREWC